MKYSISWWIHGAGRIVRGKDIIDTDVLDFSPEDAEELMDDDLIRNIPETSYNNFKPNLPNFHAKHRDLMIEAHHTEVSNWGILKVKRIKEVSKS